jgi:hypothetical protein
LKFEIPVHRLLTTRALSSGGLWSPSPPEGREPGYRSKFVQAFALRFFAALFFVLPLPAQDQKTPSQEFDLTLAGDSIITQPISVRKGEPRITAVVDAARQGDAAFANLELTFASHEAGSQNVSLLKPSASPQNRCIGLG